MHLIVAEAEDGTWFDHPDIVDGLDHARKVAHQVWDGRLPKGYAVLLYEARYVEHVEVVVASKGE